MTSSPHREIDDEGRLDEHYVQDAFHSYLKSSLAQAKAERLLDVMVLSSAEGDLMITGESIQASSCAQMFIVYDYDPPMAIRTRTVPLLRGTTLHHRPTFGPSSPPRRKSEGQVQPTRHEPPLLHQLSRSLHPISQTLVFLRPHDPTPRAGIPTRSGSHHLRIATPRPTSTSRPEPPRCGFAVHLNRD